MAMGSAREGVRRRKGYQKHCPLVVRRPNTTTLSSRLKELASERRRFGYRRLNQMPKWGITSNRNSDSLETGGQVSQLRLLNQRPSFLNVTSFAPPVIVKPLAC
jgi:hypothetical protein